MYLQRLRENKYNKQNFSKLLRFNEIIKFSSNNLNFMPKREGSSRALIFTCWLTIGKNGSHCRGLLFFTIVFMQMLIFYSVFPSKWLFICIRVLDLDLFFYKVLACIVYLGTCRHFTSLLCNSQLLLSGMHVIFVSIFPDCLKKFVLCLWCSIDFQKLTKIPRFPRVTKL